MTIVTVGGENARIAGLSPLHSNPRRPPNFAKPKATFADGDFTFNGAVDSADFTVLVAKFGTSPPSAAGALPSAAARRVAGSSLVDSADDESNGLPDALA